MDDAAQTIHSGSNPSNTGAKQPEHDKVASRVVLDFAAAEAE
jgi:hypothetical protein